MNIRTEHTGDVSSIRAVNQAAFGESEEADLVDRLRMDGHALVSLVAEIDTRIVGHILFSRMWIDTGGDRLPAVALAPVAVIPDHQRQGIGGRLIARGLQLLRDRGEGIVLVLGHAAYYPRFGFSTEKARLLQHPFSPEAFMALELTEGAMDGIEGSVVYPPAFGS